MLKEGVLRYGLCSHQDPTAVYTTKAGVREREGGEGSTLAKLGSSPAGPGNLGLDRGVLIGVWIIGVWEASDIGGLFLGVVKTGVVLLLGVVIPVEGAELVVTCFDGV